MIDRLRPVRSSLGGNPRSCPPPCGERCSAGGKRSVVSTRMTSALTAWLGALKRHCCLRFNRGINPLATAGWLRFNRGMNPLATLGWQGSDWVYPRIRFEGGGGAARSCISAHRRSAGGKRSVVSTRMTSALTGWLGALKRHCCLRFNRGINPLATAGLAAFQSRDKPARYGWLATFQSRDKPARYGWQGSDWVYPRIRFEGGSGGAVHPVPRDCAERNQPFGSFIHRPAEDTDGTL